MIAERNTHERKSRPNDFVHRAVNRKLALNLVGKRLISLVSGNKNTGCKRKHKRRQLRHKSVADSQIGINRKCRLKIHVVYRHADYKAADEIYNGDKNARLYVP